MSTRINSDLRCPICNERANGATAAGDHDNTPEPGALAVCLYCGSVSEYQDPGDSTGLQLRQLPEQELQAIMITDPETWNTIVFAKRVVRMRKEKYN